MPENIINAPMIGKIIKVKVNVGDEVKINDPVLTMESMKVEMDVFSPYDGKVKEVHITAGNTVEAEDKLFTLE